MTETILTKDQLFDINEFIYQNGHYRFADSKGINVWTKGEATLLKNCTQGHNMTGAIRANGRSFQTVRSIQWSGNNGVFVHDEYDVDKINVTNPGTPIHFIDYNAGTDYPVYAICNDGTTAYWITNTATKKTVYKKALTGTSGTANNSSGASILIDQKSDDSTRLGESFNGETERLVRGSSTFSAWDSTATLGTSIFPKSFCA